MAIRQLKTAREVIAFLGSDVVKQLTGCTDQTLTNWRSSGRIAHRTYLILSGALDDKRASAPPSIWGIDAPEKKKRAA